MTPGPYSLLPFLPRKRTLSPQPTVCVIYSLLGSEAYLLSVRTYRGLNLFASR